MIQWMLAIWSLIPLPFLNPAWTSGSSWFIYCWSLAWRILSITFSKQFKKSLPLYFSSGKTHVTLFCRVPSILCRAYHAVLGFPGGSDVKEPTWRAGDLSLVPESGRSPEEENDFPLQYSCLENPMDKGAWQATVHGVGDLSPYYVITNVDWVPQIIPPQSMPPGSIASCLFSPYFRRLYVEMRVCFTFLYALIVDGITF